MVRWAPQPGLSTQIAAKHRAGPQRLRRQRRRMQTSADNGRQMKHTAARRSTTRNPGTESRLRLHRPLPHSQRLRAMSRLPQFPPLQLVQIVRVTVSLHPSRVLVARSADLPGRAVFASDIVSLDVEIRDS